MTKPKNYISKIIPKKIYHQRRFFVFSFMGFIDFI